MRAAVYTGAGCLSVQEREVPAPAPGEIQIEVACAGICGTDLHIFHGAMDARVGVPAVLGHEMSGRVAAVGEGVSGWEAGRPVTVMPVVSCGACPACRAGHENVCHGLVFIGIDAPGAMQSRWNVPASVVVAVPEDLPLWHAALVEPVAVAVHDVRRSGLRPRERVVVVGGGPVGVLIAAVATGEGGDVVVVEPDGFRRDVAEGLGLSTLDPGAIDVPRFVQEWTSAAGADVAFEVSGAQAGVQTAVEVLAARGRLVQVAIHPAPRSLDLHRVFWRELTLLGARLYRREDFERAVGWVARDGDRISRLISRVVPLEGAQEAFRALERGGVMKVLVDLRTEGAAR